VLYESKKTREVLEAGAAATLYGECLQEAKERMAVDKYRDNELYKGEAITDFAGEDVCIRPIYTRD